MPNRSVVSARSLFSASIGLFLLGCLITTPALAYGPEGLFGGRPNPDNSAIVDDPVVQTGETNPERAETVLEHPRPDYDPIPLTVGSFNVFPSLEAGASYDSNIYATQSGQQGDGIFTLHPAVNAVSNWNRNALAITTSGDINYYGDHSQENFTNQITEVQGRYDILNQTWIAARGGYQYLAEPRTSPNDIGNNKEPTTFNVYSGGLTAYRGVGLIQTQIDYDVQHFDYNNPPANGIVSTTPGDNIVNESFRDRTQHTFGGRVSYDLTEDLKPYIKGQYNIRDYDEDSTRQSNGYETDVGAKWDFGGITSLDAYIGWISQDYYNFAANKINDGLDFGGTFTWNVTGLTTLILETNRSVEETTPTTFDSFMATGGSATLTHELLRNVILEGDASFTRDDFQGTATRQDNISGLGAGTRWLINRNLYTDFDYNWSHRVSTDTDQGYVDHLVTARIGVQF